MSKRIVAVNMTEQVMKGFDYYCDVHSCCVYGCPPECASIENFIVAGMKDIFKKEFERK